MIYTPDQIKALRLMRTHFPDQLTPDQLMALNAIGIAGNEKSTPEHARKMNNARVARYRARKKAGLV